MQENRNLNWFYVCCFCTVVSYFMGYLGISPRERTVVEEKVRVEEVVKEVVVKEEVVVEKKVIQWKDRTVAKTRVEKRPDGTEITENTITSTTSGSSSNSQEYTRRELVSKENYKLTDKEYNKTVEVYKPRYLLGLSVNPLEFKKPLPTVTIGARVGGLPVYVTGSYSTSLNRAEIGVLIEF
jgi:hypothetical protein